MLTIARLILAPVVAGLIVWAGYGVFRHGLIFAGLVYGAAATLFVIAALTDWLDGMLARRLNAVTPLGAALDHIADKLLTAGAMIALAATVFPLDLIVATLVLVLRDLAVSGLREGYGDKLPVDGFGKVKAAAAMIGVAFYLAFQAAGVLGAPPYLLLGLVWLARSLIWTAALLALFSAARYLRTALAS